MGYIILFLIFGGIFTVLSKLYTGSKGDKHVFFGGEVLYLISLQYAKRALLCLIIWGVMVTVGLGFLSIIPLGFMIYYGVLGFPLMSGWLVAGASGYFGDELFNNLPMWMLERYNKDSEFRLDDVIAYRYGELDWEPELYFTKWAYYDTEWVNNVYQEYEEMKREEQEQ